MMRGLALCVALAACTSGPSESDATAVWAANENANWWGMIGAAHTVRDVPIAERATSASIDCSHGGRVTVQGDFADGARVGGAFEVDNELASCNIGNTIGEDPTSPWDETVDGRVHWQSDGTTHTMDGFVHY